MAGTGGCTHLQPQPSQIHIRANQMPNSILTHEELLRMNKDVSTSAAQAQEYLEKQGYATLDMQGGQAMLSYMLLLLLHCAPPNFLPKGIRAVIKLLESEEVSQTTDTIIAAIMQKLNPAIKHMGKKADLAKAAISDTRPAADWLYRTREEMRDELQQGMETTK